MSYLYVAEFSSGHIKVGRSIDPKSRIAQHEDRVACMGHTLMRWVQYACKGNPSQAEAHLIAWCTENASVRFKSEWFAGLAYEAVAMIVKDCAESHSPAISRDSDTIDLLGGASFIARHINEGVGPITPQAVSQWKSDGIPMAWRAYLAQHWPDKAAHLIPVKEAA